MDERAVVLSQITLLALDVYRRRRELKKRTKDVFKECFPFRGDHFLSLVHTPGCELTIHDPIRKFMVKVNGYHRRSGIIHVSAKQEVEEDVRFSIENAQVGNGVEKNYGAWTVTANVDGGTVQIVTPSHYKFEPPNCLTTLGGVVSAIYRKEGRRLLLVHAGLCRGVDFDAQRFLAHRDEWVRTIKEVPQEVEATGDCFRLGSMFIPIELFDSLPFAKRLWKNFEELIGWSEKRKNPTNEPPYR